MNRLFAINLLCLSLSSAITFTAAPAAQQSRKTQPDPLEQKLIESINRLNDLIQSLHKNPGQPILETRLPEPEIHAANQLVSLMGSWRSTNVYTFKSPKQEEPN